MAKRKPKKPPVDQEDREQDLLFQEVASELKQEKYAKLWKDYGKYIVSGVVIAVAIVAGWRFWQDRQMSQREASGERFAAALQLARAGKDKEAAAAFGSIAKDGASGYATLARFREAALLAEQGDRTGAARIYQAVADADSINQTFRELALILWGYNSLDTVEPTKMTERLKPLTVSGNPWRFSALELTALLAHRAGKSKQAGDILNRLAKDSAAPATVRARAREMLSIMGKGS